MRKDQRERLNELEQTVIDHAIDGINAADECDIETKDGRGNRAWLTKGANQSISLAFNIRRLLGDKAPDEGGLSDEDYVQKIIDDANKESKRIQDRAKN